MQHNLFRSQPNRTRTLKHDDVNFRWKNVQVIYERDCVRLEQKTKHRRDLTINSTNLDNLTLMNATYAKSPFIDRTITEVMRYLAMYINVKFELEWHNYMYHFTKQKRR